RIALLDEGERVVIGVDVQPDALAAEPVRDAHAEHLRVEGGLRLEIGGEEIRVPELARAEAGQLGRGARDVWTRVLSRPEGHHRGTASSRCATRSATWSMRRRRSTRSCIQYPIRCFDRKEDA